MGRHPCERCGKEGWDYSETYCPNSNSCEYWDGHDICPSCMIYTACSLCSRAGCSYCVRVHCTDCKMTVCTNQAVNVVKRKRAKVQDDDLPPHTCRASLVVGQNRTSSVPAFIVHTFDRVHAGNSRTALQRPTMSTTLT